MIRSYLGRIFMMLVVILSVACGGVTTGDDPDTPSDVTISEVIPAQGPLSGGITVEIRGEGFTAENLLVTFGGAPGQEATVEEDGSIQVKLPARSQPGVVDVVVACANGQATLTGGFEYRDTATVAISGVNPNCGPPVGGTQVTISGTGFDDGSGNAPRVTFGGVDATGITVVSDVELTVTTPAVVAGAADVGIENANGSAAVPGAFSFATDCSGGPGGTNVWTSIVDMEYVMPRDDPPFVNGFAYFFDATDFEIPPQGSCVLDPAGSPANFLDAGLNPTLSQPSGTSVTMTKQQQSGVVYYDSGQVDSAQFTFGEAVTLTVNGGADVQAFTVNDIATAPMSEFGVSAQFGDPANFGGGVSLLSSTADVFLAWGDQKNADGTWNVDPFLGGPVGNTVNRVQVIAMAQGLDGVNHYLVCEGLDAGSFCLQGASGGLCTTPGHTVEDLFIAAGGDQIGFANGLVGVIRTNHVTFELPDGSTGSFDVGVQRVADFSIVDLF